MAVYEKVCCIYCGNADAIKYGKSSGKQRFDATGCGKIFLMKYFYNGRKLKVKTKIFEMAMNGRGVRDTARVLKIIPSILKRLVKKTICFSKSELMHDTVIGIFINQ